MPARDQAWRQYGATENPERVAQAVLLRSGAARLERFDPEALRVAFGGTVAAMEASR
jgi:hypothetical protein